MATACALPCRPLRSHSHRSQQQRSGELPWLVVSERNQLALGSLAICASDYTPVNSTQYALISTVPGQVQPAPRLLLHLRQRPRHQTRVRVARLLFAANGCTTARKCRERPHHLGGWGAQWKLFTPKDCRQLETATPSAAPPHPPVDGRKPFRATDRSIARGLCANSPRPPCGVARSLRHCQPGVLHRQRAYKTARHWRTAPSSVHTAPARQERGRQRGVHHQAG
jgi:hypothetical protein